ncbi:MAG: nuclear transport factor 2 family protein [Candidatus Lambdaproteobacteria bacterium]|nr:nuclear transport factor 2 family protein [Candidatus Lambdaproteobacteria bacterium]
MAARPTLESLVEANAAFYRAFEALDAEAMLRIWEHSDRIYCVHPGWNPLRGKGPVLDSLRRIIANTASIAFTLTDLEAHVEGKLGIVTVCEQILSRVGSERHTGAACTTNLFRFDAGTGAWKLFHHHASPATAPLEAPDVLN